MAKTQAEEIAVQVLLWLSEDQDRMGHFLGASGAAVDDLRAQAQDPAFLGAVLDFLLMDDNNVLAFCETRNLPPDIPMRARASLPGGDLPNWT